MPLSEWTRLSKTFLTQQPRLLPHEVVVLDLNFKTLKEATAFSGLLLEGSDESGELFLPIARLSLPILIENGRSQVLSVLKQYGWHAFLLDFEWTSEEIRLVNRSVTLSGSFEEILPGIKSAILSKAERIFVGSCVSGAKDPRLALQSIYAEVTKACQPQKRPLEKAPVAVS